MGVRTAAMEGLVKIALRPAFTVTRPGLAELPRPVRGGGGGGGGLLRWRGALVSLNKLACARRGLGQMNDERVP